MSENINIKTVSTEEFSMDYFSFGNGPMPLVIIPGLSAVSVMEYADSISEAYGILTDRFTVYVIERRNELPSSYSVFDMAHDTALAIRELGLNKIDLFGTSQGGMISLVMAIEFPDLINKLAVGSSTAAVSREQYDKVIGIWADLAREGKTEELCLTFGKMIYPDNIFESAKGALIESAGSITREDLERFVILADSLEGFDISDQIQNIKCPVLVMGSEDDKVLGSESSNDIFNAIGNRSESKLFMYNGYGHAVYDLAPDYKQRLLDFFS